MLNMTLVSPLQLFPDDPDKLVLVKQIFVPIHAGFGEAVKEAVGFIRTRIGVKLITVVSHALYALRVAV